MIIAYLLIAIGALFFLKNAGFVSWSWGVVWPLLLIGFGIYIAWAWKRVGSWLKQIWDKLSKKLERIFSSLHD